MPLLVKTSLQIDSYFLLNPGLMNKGYIYFFEIFETIEEWSVGVN